jgi:hypothetical protein
MTPKISTSFVAERISYCTFTINPDPTIPEIPKGGIEVSSLVNPVTDPAR